MKGTGLLSRKKNQWSVIWRASLSYAGVRSCNYRSSKFIFFLHIASTVALTDVVLKDPVVSLKRPATVIPFPLVVFGTVFIIDFDNH